MAIKLIATDLNGTLLHGDQHYNRPLLQQVLALLRDRDIQLVLSSGNQYEHLKQLFAGMPNDHLTMIAENGASIFKQDQQLFDGSLSTEQLHQFVTVDRLQPIFKHAYLILVGAHGSYTEVGAPQALLDAATKFYDQLQQVPSLTQVDDTIKKISVSTPPAKAAELVRELNTYFAGRLQAHDSGYGVIDLVNAGVGKLPAVQWLMQQWQITADEVMAFGDGDNDGPLLQFATHSYAMLNAPEKIQALAANVTELDNEHDGVLETIQRVL
ncbi:Cof-type HAD-IIB family hydrolase [Lactiplantibacillus mudanjiangensis]|uniref:HAD family hydrolase [Lactobacillus sp.] n=1 Tax=Lactiplantibacillus mudanjiangensis TaxID=1296538 RepID=A0A660DYE9_9LACO|nr:Cof-type HAD-IIB family hydrolase [Lactiplantibacillus mudanjiangensis]VDG23321.1 HAD family hydrolase [Lactobacillus sp.] [Lactiplantibacillus mudanjiangensis]VDG28282.1 HAD family hydrolase [Lactobacillus sp.] [Lactiplantibacillus mudanjiangensis]